MSSDVLIYIFFFPFYPKTPSSLYLSCSTSRSFRSSLSLANLLLQRLDFNFAALILSSELSSVVFATEARIALCCCICEQTYGHQVFAQVDSAMSYMHFLCMYRYLDILFLLLVFSGVFSGARLSLPRLEELTSSVCTAHALLLFPCVWPGGILPPGGS